MAPFCCRAYNQVMRNKFRGVGLIITGAVAPLVSLAGNIQAIPKSTSK
jgi:hypothetical protein